MSAQLVSFALRENALDYIATASDALAGETDERALKYGVLHLWSGVLLLLKERLRQEHWSLLFSDPDRADKARYDAGDFLGPNYDQLVKRLKGVCRVGMTPAARSALDTLQKMRNKLEHFGIHEQAEAVKSATAKVLEFTLDFIRNELDVAGFGSREKQDIESVRRSLRAIDTFVQQRWETVKDDPRLGEGGELCPICLHEAVIVDAGAECLFCTHAAEGPVFADEYVSTVLGYSYYEHVKHGGEWPLERCPECGEEAFARIHEGSISGVGEWRCFTCGACYSSGSLEHCQYCSTLFCPQVPGMGICDACLDAKIRRG